MDKTKLLLLLLIIAGGINLNAQVWEDVGNTGDLSDSYGSFPHIAADNQGNYYVSYYEGETTSGAVKKFNGTQWSFLGSNGSTIGAEYNILSSIVVDKNNVPYLVNRSDLNWDTFTYSTLIAKFENGGWVSLPTVESLPSCLAATFTSDNKLVFATTAGDGMVLKYNGTAWDTIGKPGFDTSGGIRFLDMVIDSKDHLYVSYVGNDDNLYVYSVDANASPLTEWAPVGYGSYLANSTSYEQYSSAIAIDSNDNLYVEYVSPYSGGNKVTVLKYNGSSWKTLGNPNFTPSIAQHVDVAVSKNGKPFVIYSNFDDYNHTKNFVMSYDSVSNQWTVVGGGCVSEGNALFNTIYCDQNDDIIIAYTDSGKEDRVQAKKLNNSGIAPDSIGIFIPDHLEASISVDNGILQVSATVFPLNAPQKVVWSIIHGEKKATISESGLITATSNNGIVTIKATAPNSPSVYDTLNITLTNQVSDVNPDSVIITCTDEVPDIFKIGNTLQLNVAIIPEEADQQFEWSIVNGQGIISIGENGLVTGLSDGFATIRASVKNNNEIYSDFHVTVFSNGVCYGTETMNLIYGFDITKETSGYLFADDFIVEQGQKIEVRKVRLSILADMGTVFNDVDLTFLTDENDAPKNIIAAIKNIQVLSQKCVYDDGLTNEFMIEFNLEEPVTLGDGKYWMMPKVSTKNGESIYWNTSLGSLGSSLHYSVGGGWSTIDDFDGVFTIEGNLSALNYDVSISNFNFNLPRQTPKAQISGVNKLNIKVANNGIEAAKARLTVNDDSQVYFTDSVTLASKESKNVDCSIDLGEIKEATTINLTSNLTTANDDFLANNTNYLSLVVSDSTYIADYADEPNVDNGIGNNSTTLFMGTVFTIFKPAYLTSANIMFIENEEIQDEEFGVYVFKVFQNDSVDTEFPVVEEVFVRGLGGDAANFTLSPVKLGTGTYLFGVGQLRAVNIGLNVDYLTNGVVQLVKENHLYPVSGFGSIHFRPNFGNYVEDTTSINNQPADINVSLFPNPAIDQCTITSETLIHNIEIYSVAGNLIGMELAGSNEIKLKTNYLKSGIYIVKVNTANGSRLLKLGVTK
jgi:hypothetical protein